MKAKRERYVYRVHVICRFLLAISDLCGKPPSSGSLVSAVWFVVCSRWTLDAVVGDSVYSWPLPNPPSITFCPALYWLHSLFLPISKAQALLPSSVHWTHGEDITPCHSKLSLPLLFLSFSPLASPLLQSLMGGRRQTLCSQMPLNTSASMSGSSENYPTIFFSRDLSISVASKPAAGEREIVMGWNVPLKCDCTLR